MDCEVDRGAGYGNTLNWESGMNPGLGEQQVHVQDDLDTLRLYQDFVHLLTSPTPRARGTP